MPRSGSRVRVSFPAPGHGDDPATAAMFATRASACRGFFVSAVEIADKVREPCRSPPAGWQSGYAADCKSAYAGSIPTSASNQASIPAAAGIFVCSGRGAPCPARPDGETGRRKGLKIPHLKGYVGSIPTPGTRTALAARDSKRVATRCSVWQRAGSGGRGSIPTPGTSADLAAH